MVMASCAVITDLISLGVLTDERLIIGGKCWSVVVDVQHPDVYGHAAYLSWVVWETQKGGHGDFTQIVIPLHNC